MDDSFLFASLTDEELGYYAEAVEAELDYEIELAKEKRGKKRHD